MALREFKCSECGETMKAKYSKDPKYCMYCGSTSIYDPLIRWTMERRAVEEKKAVPICRSFGEEELFNLGCTSCHNSYIDRWRACREKQIKHFDEMAHYFNDHKEEANEDVQL